MNQAPTLFTLYILTCGFDESNPYIIRIAKKGKKGTVPFFHFHSYLNDSAGLAHAAFRVCGATARNAVNKVTRSVIFTVTCPFKLDEKDNPQNIT